MNPTNQIDPHVYQAAHHTAVIVDRSDLGRLKFSGATRLDLLHRMSTQAVNALQAGEGAATILTTDIGRIIDRLLLYADDASVLVLTGENNADFIARYLLRFVFFNDDFRLENVGNDTAVFGVYGPQAEQMLAAAGFPETDLPPPPLATGGHWRRHRHPAPHRPHRRRRLFCDGPARRQRHTTRPLARRRAYRRRRNRLRLSAPGKRQSALRP